MVAYNISILAEGLHFNALVNYCYIAETCTCICSLYIHEYYIDTVMFIDAYNIHSENIVNIDSRVCTKVCEW